MVGRVSERLRLTAAVTVDLVVLTVREDVLTVLLIRRGLDPFKDRWALPGGFVREAEGLLDAAQRELVEETGISSIGGHLEQLATYGDPGRDPRGRVVSIAYLALVPEPSSPTAGTDATEADWIPLEKAMARATALAFDHRVILRDGIERARSKLEYTSLAAAFCSEEFTVADLRRIYETVWATSLDPRNFHRKVTGTVGFVQPTGRSTTRDGGRPAQLYRRGPAALLYPPLLRP